MSNLIQYVTPGVNHNVNCGDYDVYSTLYLKFKKNQSYLDSNSYVKKLLLHKLH